MKMLRKQVYITQEQDRELKRVAEELGTSEAEVLRRAVDGLRDARQRPSARDRFVREAAVMGYVARGEEEVRRERRLDDRAWEEELAFLEELARQPARARRAEWRREDAYDRRRLRLPD